MRILICVSSLQYGGKERQIFELMKGLIAHNITCIVVSLSNTVTIQISENISKCIIALDESKCKLQRAYDFYKVLVEYKPTIVHAWDDISTEIAVIFKYIMKYKLIDCRVRGSHKYYKRLVSMFICHPFVDILVANSIAGMNSVNKTLDSKHLVVYNGIDLDRFKNVRSNNAYEKYMKFFTVCMIANVRDEKDYKSYIEVAEEINKRYNNTMFVSAGCGDIGNVVKILSPRIEHLGAISNVESLLKYVDLGLLLTNSKCAKEGTSNSILEYMATGLPVIATNSGGTPELIEHEYNGYLVSEDNNVNEITQYIEILITNEAHRQTLGDRGKSIVSNRYDSSIMINNYISIYKNICNTNNMLSRDTDI